MASSARGASFLAAPETVPEAHIVPWRSVEHRTKHEERAGCQRGTHRNDLVVFPRLPVLEDRRLEDA